MTIQPINGSSQNPLVGELNTVNQELVYAEQQADDAPYGSAANIAWSKLITPLLQEGQTLFDAIQNGQTCLNKNQCHTIYIAGNALWALVGYFSNVPNFLFTSWADFDENLNILGFGASIDSRKDIGLQG